MISKLPNTGTSIFAVMSKMAVEHNAINLAQGYPGFDISPELVQLVNHYMAQGMNQYAPMPGVPKLRKAIAKKVNTIYDCQVNADTEITVSAGATQSLYTCISAIVKAGDEVIYFDPAYESYQPAIVLNGGVPVNINLHTPEFSIPWQEVEQKITDKTKLIIINNPQNPSGAVLTNADLEQLNELIKGKDIYVLSDEVYEHIIFDGHTHSSVLGHEELRKKSMAVYSFGKTFHATGWKMGYTIAPKIITDEIRKIHQFMVFSVNTPAQHAVADYLSNPENYLSLPTFYQEKRDFFLNKMKGSRFEPIPCSGTYFQTFSYKQISLEADQAMAERITKEYGVASIPISPFYTDNQDEKLLRFCFAKNNDELEKAAEILCKI